MAAKTIAVIGATGLQGGSVVTALLADGGFKVRALTRDVDKAAQLKAKGVEVVVADVDNTDTLRAAFKGVHGVFAMTSTGPSDEAAQGKNIADAAKAEGIAHLVWSTLENVSKRSGGKYTKVRGFDNKAIVQDYINKIGVPASFVMPSSFMTNYTTARSLKLSEDGSSYTLDPMFGRNRYFIDIEADMGAIVLGLFKNRDEWLGKTIPVTVIADDSVLSEGAAKALGKPVSLVRNPPEVVYPVLDPPVPILEMLREMVYYMNEFGYYDPAHDFTAAEKLAGRPLTSPQEFFARFYANGNGVVRASPESH